MTSGRWEDGNEQQNEQQEDILDWVEKSDKVCHFRATFQAFPWLICQDWNDICFN